MKTNNIHMLYSLFHLGYEQDSHTLLKDRHQYHFSKRNVHIVLELPIMDGREVWEDKNFGVTDVVIDGGDSETYANWKRKTEKGLKEWNQRLHLEFPLSRSLQEELADIEAGQRPLIEEERCPLKEKDSPFFGG
jgi:hypothetical protein